MMRLSDDEVEDLLGPVVDDLASAGVAVLWPQEMMREVAPSTALRRSRRMTVVRRQSAD